MTSPGDTGPSVTSAGLAARIAAFMLIGIPLVAFVWETLNELFAGREVIRHLLLAIPGIVLLIFFFRLMSRAIQKWDERLHPGPPTQRLP